MKKNLLSIFTVLIISIMLAACNNDNANDDNNQNNDSNISSLTTDQSSNDYPETQPIKTQDAKYEYREAPEGQQASPGNKAPNTNNVANKPPAQQKAQNENYALSNFENDVVTLTNKERKQAGLSLLEVDNALSNVAREKSNDMQQKGYFSHTSPTYGSPFDMMRDFGITYQSAGENIAQGQRTPDEVVQAWMNSEGHRANILNANFTHIGVGYDPDGQHWTQMFIRK